MTKFESPTEASQTKWQESGSSILAIQTPHYASGVKFNHWEYALQKTESDVFPPRARIAATVRRPYQGNVKESFFIEYTGEAFVSDRPDLAEKMGGKDNVLRFAKLAYESVEHGVQAAQQEKAQGSHVQRLQSSKVVNGPTP